MYRRSEPNSETRHRIYQCNRQIPRLDFVSNFLLRWLAPPATIVTVVLVIVTIVLLYIPRPLFSAPDFCLVQVVLLMSQQYSPARASTSKIAIPRLLNRRHDPPPPKNNIVRLNRVPKACLACRSRKIRCNGATPRCANCGDNPEPCVYASSRKDRLRTCVS